MTGDDDASRPPLSPAVCARVFRMLRMPSGCLLLIGWFIQSGGQDY